MAFRALAILPLLLAGISASPASSRPEDLSVIGENMAEIRELVDAVSKITPEELERHDWDVVRN